MQNTLDRGCCREAKPPRLQEWPKRGWSALPRGRCHSRAQQPHPACPPAAFLPHGSCSQRHDQRRHGKSRDQSGWSSDRCWTRGRCICLWSSTGAPSSAAEGEGWKPGKRFIGGCSPKGRRETRPLAASLPAPAAARRRAAWHEGLPALPGAAATERHGAEPSRAAALPGKDC